MIRGILLFLAVFGVQIKAEAQPVTYSYTWYNTQNIGLSHNTITSITLGPNGFLWVGTMDGLNRFDGKSVKIYRHDASDSTSISDNFIHGILVDEEGALWIGTRDGGINRFNPKTETFKRFQYSERNENGIPKAPVYMLYKDQEGDFWASIGTEAFGIFHPESGAFQRARIKDRTTQKPLNSPNALVEFKDGSRLAAAYNGLYYILAKEVAAFKKDESKSIIYADKIEGLKTANVQNFSSIIIDDLNQIWAYSQNGGPLKVPGNLLSNKMKASIKTGVANEPNQSQYVENAHYLMGAAGDRGLLFINKKTGKRTYQPIIVGGSQFSPTSIYHDPEGGIWASSWGAGFVRIKEQTAITLVSPENNPNMGLPFMLAFEEESGKGIWFAGQQGVRFWDDRKQRVQKYELLEAELSDKQIWSLERGEKGLWIITVTEGMFYVPLNNAGIPNGEVRRFTPGNSFLTSFYLHQVFIDSRGWMWVGYEGDGLQLVKNPTALLNSGPVNVTHFSGQELAERRIGGDKIRRIYEDNQGNIWLATMENGFTQIRIAGQQVGGISVFRNDPENPQTISFNDGRSIYQQNDTTYWLATYGGGINRFNPKTNIFTKYGTEEGLPNNSTYGILPDVDGIHVWISTNNGLARMNTETHTFNAFTEEDNIQNKEFNTGAFLWMKDGRLVFGGIGGFNIIDSQKLKINREKPPVKLTGIKLFNEPYISDTGSVFRQRLELPYNKNFLSFEFAALDYEKPKENAYAYKMGGVDEQWVESGNRNFADYPNLEPGEYQFRVKGANSDGVWNEDGIRLGIIITPPWWATWWFRTLVGLTFFIAFAAGIRYISQRRLRQQIHQMEIENKLRGERERISRDLHDHVGAQLANIISGLSLAKKYQETNNEGRSTELIHSLSGDASLTIKQLRETIWALNQNSLDLDGFIDYLKQYFKNQSALSDQLKIQYILEAEGVTLSSTQALNIFRIIQEAAQNTLKHAGAENMRISFKQQKQVLVVCIKDDGIFKQSETALDEGYGFGNMKKRAAELNGRVERDVKNGTEIKIIIPV